MGITYKWMNIKDNTKIRLIEAFELGRDNPEMDDPYEITSLYSRKFRNGRLWADGYKDYPVFRCPFKMNSQSYFSYRDGFNAAKNQS